MKNTLKRFSAAAVAFVFALMLLPLAFSVTASADIWDGTTVATGFTGGTGTEADPYIVGNAAQLAYLASDTALTDSLGKYYKLTVDIELNNLPWKPIGTDTNFFKGFFDGDNHTISGLFCDTEIVASGVAGLFGETSSTIIKNLTVTGSKICAKYTGPIVGRGRATTIINCKSDVDWIDGSAVGGIAGRLQEGTAEFPNLIKYCISDSEIKQTMKTTDIYAGGIIGAAGGTEVIFCRNNGNLTFDREDLANNASTATTCVGGIVGVLGASSQKSDIRYCINTGDITGYRTISTTATDTNCNAGGLAGRSGHVAGSIIEGNISTGTVTWTTDKGSTEPATGRFGGLIGQIRGATTLLNCYTTMDVLVGTNTASSEIPESAKTLTLEQMQGDAAFTNMNLVSDLSILVSDTATRIINESQYFDYQLEAFENYTSGKTLKQYIIDAVIGQVSLGEGAVVYVANPGDIPSFGSLETIEAFLTIAGELETQLTEALTGVYDLYVADPANTTMSDEETEPDDETTELTKIVVVGPDGVIPSDTTIGGGSSSTTAAPSNDNNNNNNNNTQQNKGDDEGGCGGFTAIAAVLAIVCGTATFAILKKH